MKAALEVMILCRCSDEDRERLDQAVNGLLKVLPANTAAVELIDAAHAAHQYIGGLDASVEGTAIYERLSNALAPKEQDDA